MDVIRDILDMILPLSSFTTQDTNIRKNKE